MDDLLNRFIDMNTEEYSGDTDSLFVVYLSKGISKEDMEIMVRENKKYSEDPIYYFERMRDF